MIKVTLLGDSIRAIGYGKMVPELLKDEFEVWQPSENCRFSKYTLRGVYDWRKEMEGSRIIHWNNGLWDVCDLFGDGWFTSEQEYIENMLRVADLLLARYEKVIFATTTPVKGPDKTKKNEGIIQYNNALVPLLQEKGIIINDLHSTVYQNIDLYICDDNIHLSEAGIEVCSKQVADIIRKTSLTLGEPQKITPTEENLTAVPV